MSFLLRHVFWGGEEHLGFFLGVKCVLWVNERPKGNSLVHRGSQKCLLI